MKRSLTHAPELPGRPKIGAAWARTRAGPHPEGGALNGAAVGTARPGTGGGGPAGSIAEDIGFGKWLSKYSGDGDTGRCDAGGGDVGCGGRGESGVPGVGWRAGGAEWAGLLG